MNSKSKAMRIVQMTLDDVLGGDLAAQQSGEADKDNTVAEGETDGFSPEEHVEVSEASGDEVCYTFRFSYKPDSYDSKVVDREEVIEQSKGNAGEGEEDVTEEVEESTAEDAAPTAQTPAAAAQTCKATFAQCQAKNPYACRFHGQKLMEADLNNLLAQNGSQTAKVTMEELSPGSYEAKVTCINTPAERKAAAAAIKAFLKNAGIDQSSVIDTGYDKKAKAHSAFFDVDDLNAGATSNSTMHAAKPKKRKVSPKPTPPQAPAQSQPPAPSPAPAEEPPVAPTGPAPLVSGNGRLAPPMAPEEPPAWDGLTNEEMDKLDKISSDLAFVMQRVNRNLSQGKTGAGNSAGAAYDAIDRNELVDLAKKDKTGQVQKLIDVYDDAAKSKANGWGTAFGTYDPNLYNAHDPKGATNYSAWGFDRTKCPVDPHAAARAAFNAWKPPADGRKAELDALETAIGGASAKEKPALDSALKDAKDASEVMRDLEENVGIIKKAIDDATDPAVKDLFQKAMEDVEGAYFDADKAYKDAVGVIKDWSGKQVVMQDSIADTIAAIKARGGKPHPLLKNWQSVIDKHEKDAMDFIAKRFNLTPAERAAAPAIYKKNMRALMEKGTIASITSNKSVKMMLDGTRTVGSPPTGWYGTIAQNNFDADPYTLSDSFAFCRPLPDDASNFTMWWHGECAVIANPKKAVLSVTSDLYNGADKYGSLKGEDSSGYTRIACAVTSLLSDANLTSSLGENIVRRALTEDLTGLPTRQFYQALGIGNPSGPGYEVLAVGGISAEQCGGLKFYKSVPNFTKAQKSTLKKYNIPVYDQNGNLVAI